MRVNLRGGAPSLKTQSPSTLGWRLRVEVRQTRSFVTVMDLTHAISHHGSGHGRGHGRTATEVLVSQVDAYGRLPDCAGQVMLGTHLVEGKVGLCPGKAIKGILVPWIADPRALTRGCCRFL